MRSLVPVHFSLLLLAALPALAQPAAPADSSNNEYSLREHYTKYEYRIPMRDGKHLFTQVLVPKDAGAGHSYPFLVNRTPYSVAPYGVDEYPRRLSPSTVDFAKAGYIFVNQDVRGRFQSEGSFVEMTPYKDNKGPQDVDESSDMYDTVEWLLHHVPNNNGRVGIWGISYPGFYTAASIVDSHPAIKAASPQAPMADLFMGDDAYHNGAFMLAANFGFYTFFKQQATPVAPAKTPVPFDYGTQDGYEFFLNAGPLADIAKKVDPEQRVLLADQLKNDSYNGYWQSRALAPHMKNIKAAVLTVGGWFDAEDLQGPLAIYRAVKKNNPNIAFNALVMGPWPHGGWNGNDGARMGYVSFSTKTGEEFRKNIQLPFFEKFLKDKEGGGAATAKLSEAMVFETGSNVWRHYPAWPPVQAKPRTLYFSAGHALKWTAPGATGNAAGEAFDEYVSDPAKPVPFSRAISTSVPRDYMVDDQRFVASRTDVLVYQSEVLEADVTVAGPVVPSLFVSTSGSDSDFVVKLIDVFPAEMSNPASGSDTGGRPRDVQPPTQVMAGYQMLVRGEPFRAKFRRSFSKPEPMTPGKVEALEFTMPDINHTFRRGHRIMVQVQSSWFPLVDRNPQTFVRIPEAKASDFVKATQRVYHTAQQASAIKLMVMPGEQ
jgi:putative CocE/NonD family hydrolase